MKAYGEVGFGDFVVVATNYGQGGDFTNDATAVSEPVGGSLAAMTLWIVVLLRRRS